MNDIDISKVDLNLLVALQALLHEARARTPAEVVSAVGQVGGGMLRTCVPTGGSTALLYWLAAGAAAGVGWR